jgi:hypothetical protein
MDDREPITEAAVKKMLVGDTIEMRVQREALDGEARDRVVPVIGPPATPGGEPTLTGFSKSAAGEWELEKVLGPKGSVTVEIVVRRIAS